MTELAIRTQNLRKVYRLYTRPRYRVLDVFGLLRRSAGAYSEHVALTDVNLEIRRGEKVALIGRNGAGKSTFLKLATRVTEPTSGKIQVSGQTHALLQIGTGFHPDFTGRENVFAYLAHLGVTGKEAQGRLAEIVEFAELEEYIDQPVKTYSTGMGTRLMFATSTVISPDILVLDEVLGVGDAYFARKSYDRIRELCDKHDTTVLLVTHDIYSAAKICDRMIWIDRGRVVMDAASSVIMTAYEDSVREQEESRLRKRKLESLRVEGGSSSEPETEHILVEIRGRNNRPQPCPVYFSKISLLLDGQWIDSLPLGPDTPITAAGAHLQMEDTCWGDAEFFQGRQARSMRNYGSSFHKIAGLFAVPAAALVGPKHDVHVRLSYLSEVPCSVELVVYYRGTAVSAGAVPPASGQWLEHDVHVALGGTESFRPAALPNINPTGQHGSGVITVTNVCCRNATGWETHFVNHGEAIEFQIDYQINKPDFCEPAQVLIALHRDGIHDVCRFMTRDLQFDVAKGRTGTVRARLPRLPLADGTYTVTVMVAAEGYYDQEQALFYSINPRVYACLVRVIEIVVQKGGAAAKGTGVLIDAEWSLHSALSPHDMATRHPGARVA